jgi:peptidoglycan endopeptidase LytE
MRRRVLPAAALLAVLPLSVDVLVGTAAAAQPARPAARPATGTNGSSSGTTNYTVQPGDFLIGIANKLGIRLDDLLRLNGLSATSVVHPGRVLKVPLRLATYTVKPNDTMSGIASRHGMTMADLLAANGLKASSVLVPGMVLKVAAKASSPAPAPSTTVKPAAPTTTAPKVGSSNKASTYTVASGDFLIGIANKLGIRLVDLLALNGLTLTSAVHPGTVLQVPAGTKTPTTPTTTPTTAPPTTIPGAPKPGGTYTVVAGDFLLGIARKLNVRFSDLLAVNQLGADSVVHPGTVLAVPATKLPPTTPTTTVPTPTTTAPSGAVPYIVRSGDSVLGISYRFGLKYGPILRLNGISLDTPLQPGATLLLPPGTVIPPTPTTTAPPTTSAPTTTVPAPSNDPIDRVVAFAKAQTGKPYKFFTAGPDTYDCSGLTLAAYLQIGVRLPHQSLAQSKLGTSIDWTTEPIKAGDLVFTQSSRAPGVIGHVGIAISSTRWVHAPRANDVVREGPLPPASMIVVVRRYVND